MQSMKRLAASFSLAAILVVSGAPLLSPVLPAMAQQQVQSNSASAILSRLKQANGIPADAGKTITILESSDLNAATNGETIAFSQGLWNALDTDDERAFVIAHELSHITLNHIPKTQARKVGLSILGSLLGRVINVDSAAAGQLVNVAENVGITLVDKKFSRGAELSADNSAITYMANAGYNPHAALQVFDILEREAPTSGTPEFLQDHPVSATRIQALSQKIATYDNRRGTSAVQELPLAQQQQAQPVPTVTRMQTTTTTTTATSASSNAVQNYGPPVIILRQIIRP